MFQFTRNERKNFFRKKEMTVHQIKSGTLTTLLAVWAAVSGDRLSIWHFFWSDSWHCCCCCCFVENAGQGRTVWLEARLDEDGRLPEKTTTTKVNRRAKERPDNLLLRKSQFVRRAWLPNKTTFCRYVSESLSFEYITGAIVASFFEVLLADLYFFRWWA